MKLLRGDRMAASTLKLDRATFDFIQSNLANCGYEDAAGYMVVMASEFRNSFSTKRMNINTHGHFTQAQVQRLVDEAFAG